MVKPLSIWQADCLHRETRHTVNLDCAVLGLQFTRFREGVFAIATSKGEVCLFTINFSRTGPIEHIDTYQIFSKSLITLSVAWSSIPAHSDIIAASSSDGQVAIFSTKSQSPTTCTKTEAHSLEAWTLSWTLEGADLYSGGDDSTLCRHALSLRSVSGSLNEDEIPSHEYHFHAPLRDTKTHTAGVTAILPLQLASPGEQALLTGSYDEHVRLLLPTAGGSRPKFLAEQRLGGGVWSLKILNFVTPGDNGGT